jgi:hypothetical protein
VPPVLGWLQCLQASLLLFQDNWNSHSVFLEGGLSYVCRSYYSVYMCVVISKNETTIDTIRLSFLYRNSSVSDFTKEHIPSWTGLLTC